MQPTSIRRTLDARGTRRPDVGAKSRFHDDAKSIIVVKVILELRFAQERRGCAEPYFDQKMLPKRAPSDTTRQVDFKNVAPFSLQ